MPPERTDGDRTSEDGHETSTPLDPRADGRDRPGRRRLRRSRAPTILGASLIFTATVAFLATAILGAIARRGRARVAWAGVAVFGWAYFAMSFGPLPNMNGVICPPFPTQILLESLRHVREEADQALSAQHPQRASPARLPSPETISNAIRQNATTHVHSQRRLRGSLRPLVLPSVLSISKRGSRGREPDPRHPRARPDARPRRHGPRAGRAGSEPRFRLLLAVALAALIAPVVGPGMASPTGWGDVAAACIGEAVVGAALGWAAGLVIAGARQAGEVVGAQAGLSAAALFDPDAGDGLTPMGHLYGLVALGVFLALDGPLDARAGAGRELRGDAVGRAGDVE